MLQKLEVIYSLSCLPPKSSMRHQRKVHSTLQKHHAAVSRSYVITNVYIQSRLSA